MQEIFEVNCDGFGIWICPFFFLNLQISFLQKNKQSFMKLFINFIDLLIKSKQTTAWNKNVLQNDKM